MYVYTLVLGNSDVYHYIIMQANNLFESQL